MKKLVALALTLCMLLTAMPVFAVAEEYREPITLTVFSQLANYAGEQQGWFAKEIQDRFNVTLNFISTNLDTNAYNAAVSAGELGDIINFGDTGDQFIDAVKSEMLLDWNEVDMTPYANITAYTKDSSDKLTKFVAETTGIEGYWGFGHDIGMENGAWAELTDPTYAMQIRYDAWEKAGKPELKTLEDLPDFLAALQAAVPENENGEKVYAYGGFGDWEDCVMKFTWDLMTYYGYQEYDFMGVNYATQEVVNPLEDGSLYYRALKVNNELYRRGLFDPESVSQNYDTYNTKLVGGRYLMAMWGWIISGFNSAEKAENKVGFTTFRFEDSAPAVQSISTWGGNRLWCVGADCEYPERALEIIDWLCSEEGNIVSNYGPQGLCWDYGEDGVPYMTDFGWQCQEDKDNTQMPAENGGGTYGDGVSAFNHTTLKLEQMIPGKTYSLSNKGWPCYAERYATNLSKAWSEEYANGATSGVELYRNTKASVDPVYEFTKAPLSAEGQEKRALFAPEMKTGSWNCVYAETEEEFEKLWDEMVAKCKSLGYDDVVAEKMVDIQKCFDAINAANPQ